MTDEPRGIIVPPERPGAANNVGVAVATLPAAVIGGVGVSIRTQMAFGRSINLDVSKLQPAPAVELGQQWVPVWREGHDPADVFRLPVDVIPTDAPHDGFVYGRMNGAWVNVTDSVTISWDSVIDKPATFPPTLPIDQSGITGLEARFAAVEAKNTEQDGRLTAVEGVNATQNTRLDGAEGRLTAVEGVNATQNGRLDAVEAKNTEQDGRLTAVEGVNATQNGRLTTNEGAIAAVEGVNATQNTRLDAVEAKNTAQDGRLTTNEAAIATLQTDVAGKIGDAPNNANQYARQGGAWVVVAAGGVTDGDKGDIVVSSSGTVWTLDNSVVSNAKFRDSAGLSIVGRSTNTTGNVSDIIAGTDGHVLRRSGTVLGFGTVATAGLADAAVTLAKQANLAAATVIGRASGAGTGVPTALTGAQVRAVAGAVAILGETSRVILNHGSLPGNGRLFIKQAADGTYTGEGLALSNNAITAVWTMMTDVSNGLYFGFNSASKGFIDATTGAYTAVSDRDLKENIETIEPGWGAIKALRPVRYTMKDDAEHRPQLGFIAQEVELVIPDAVVPPKEAGAQKFYMMDKTALIPHLVSTVQELQSRLVEAELNNTALRSVVDELLSRVETLEAKD